MTCGIYAICHLPSNSRYIGGSKNIEKRWSWHRTTLNKGIHYCSRLQEYWSKDSTKIAFKILDECQPDELLLREQIFLDSTPTELLLNECRIATRHGRIISDKTKDILRQAAIDQWKTQDHFKAAEYLNRNRTPQSRRESSIKSWTKERRELARIKTETQWALGNGRARSKGYRHTEETRAKLRAAWILRKLHNGGINNARHQAQ